MQLKQGDIVRVFPHGKEKLAATATVILISGNQRSIAVGFGESPPFAMGGGRAISAEHGLMLFAMREELNGKPWGPWVDLFAGGHYEIEATT